jgi:taurine dioxygenase
MATTRMIVRRLAGSCGADIEGVDLARSVDAQTVAELRRALLDHQVICIRGQQALDDAGLERVTALFGGFGVEPYVEGEESHPHVLKVVKEADERRTSNFGGNWHSDWSFMETPPAFTFLHAREIPPFGGDTMFANQYLAYETLSEGLRATLDGMSAMHSARRPYGPKGVYADRSKARSMKITASESAEQEIEQPVVRVHAETGRKALYVNPVYTIRFKGMTEKESAPLLGYLYEHSVRPEFTCRVRWSEGALTIWDNRAVQHFALNDYDGYRRELHRTTVAGEKPIAPSEARNLKAAE